MTHFSAYPFNIHMNCHPKQGGTNVPPERCNMRLLHTAETRKIIWYFTFLIYITDVHSWQIGMIPCFCESFRPTKSAQIFLTTIMSLCWNCVWHMWHTWGKRWNKHGTHWNASQHTRARQLAAQSDGKTHSLYITGPPQQYIRQCVDNCLSWA